MAYISVNCNLPVVKAMLDVFMDDYPFSRLKGSDKQSVTHKLETSFYELLLDQLGMLKLDERTRKIAEQIVGSIDDDGYLRRETASIVESKKCEF